METSAKSTKRRRQGHISVACLACKNRRSKCSGGPPPCSLCAKLETECSFDPNADMRRRASRDSTKTYKALLDAFVDSLRRDDVSLSYALHHVLTTVDPSGKLREVAEEYAETVRPGWLLLLQGADTEGTLRYTDTVPGLLLNLPSMDDLDDYLGLSAYSLSNSSSPMVQNPGESSARPAQVNFFQQSPQTDPASPPPAILTNPAYTLPLNNEGDATSKGEASQDAAFSRDELKAHLQEHLDNRQLTIHDLPIFSCDPFVSEPDDPMSVSILAFRDSARQAVSSGAAMSTILETCKPDLTLMFRERRDSDPHTAWTWACDFAKAIEGLAFPLRLATVYMAGIQMRFFIDPCEQTFDDLPEMLRPLLKQYQVVHPAAVDLCHIPAVKNILLGEWDRYVGLLAVGHSCNWPYSNEACLATEREGSRITASRAFYEHVRKTSSFSVGKMILDSAPALRGQVRIIGE